ncbi:cytochrome c1 [Aspergillus melleus]|uniref:Cytochrome c1 n=1 Tax=Aspergillus melleus TaxID=138277 RepID=A0ACC3B0Y4_9EURO|nr:cytochrome c1 [Aspergillus melleus]
MDSVLVTECTGGNADSGAYWLQHVDLDVQAYQLHIPFEQESFQTTDDLINTSEDGSKAKVMTLPCKELDGLWESLHFDEPIQTTILRAVTRMVSFSSRNLDQWTISWNRLILLWGPPGTGKTSFCRGLSQKLAIRLGKHYPRSKLVELNAHSLGSKFFGESGKIVSKTFENIELLLETEEDTFVYVFVDEVETLAARRERALAGNEPFDAVRAVNALLTGLDRLKKYDNVVVICTSNLVTALDEAFLDRVDVKQYIPHLSSRIIYGIFKECLEELSRRGIIEGMSFDVIQQDPENPFTTLQYVERPTERLVLPAFDEMLLHYQGFVNAIPKQLADSASESVGLSGRTIRRLPALSLVLYSPSSAGCGVGTAIQALRMGIASERQAKAEAHVRLPRPPVPNPPAPPSSSPSLPLSQPPPLSGRPPGTTISMDRKLSPRRLPRRGESIVAEILGDGPEGKSPLLRPTRPYHIESVKLTSGSQDCTRLPTLGSMPSGPRPSITPRDLRRGFQVYREVCASCHSLTRVPWRSFVGVMHTVDEMKAFAEENEYDTEPNDQGEIEKRPGKLSDYIPAPYKNEEAARAANAGSLPPDLSLIVKGRHGGCDYIFSLLTGYPDEPPAGATVQEGMNFNPYFPGTAIAMGRVLFDGVVEYEDGTPATTSQMAKDVVEFLNWSAEPEMDDRKKMGVKALTLLTGLFAVSVWVKRYKWSPIKTRKIVYSPPVSRR